VKYVYSFSGDIVENSQYSYYLLLLNKKYIYVVNSIFIWGRRFLNFELDCAVRTRRGFDPLSPPQ